MEVDELQTKIAEFGKLWAIKQKRSLSEQITFNHIVEEVGELAMSFVNRDIRKDKYDDKELNNSIGDILIHVIELASIRGLKLENLIVSIIKEDSKRL